MKIKHDEILELSEDFAFGNVLYYSYDQLYAFWMNSMNDDTLSEKISRPQNPQSDDLCMNDFNTLGCELANCGYIG